MDLDKLMGRYFRLKQELSIAYRARPWESGCIDRLANDLAATEREIASRQGSRAHERADATPQALHPDRFGAHAAGMLGT